MKKTFRLMLIALISVSFFSCGDDKDETTDDPNKGNQPNEVIDDGDVTYKSPELTFWNMDTKRGIPTLTMKIRNPNNATISFSCNIVFKSGDKTFTEKDWGEVCLAAGETIVNWGTPNIELNDAKGIDDIEVTFSEVSKSLYTPVKITTTQDELNGDNDHKIAFKADGDFTDCYVTVLYYNGDELLSIATDRRFNSDKTPLVFEDIENHTRHEIYYNAYK